LTGPGVKAIFEEKRRVRVPTISVNRAPVLTLWASVVAERLGYEEDTALSLAKAVAGLNAQSKGRRLGIYKPAEPAERLAKKKIPREKPVWVEILGRIVPARSTAKGLRALDKDKPIEPASVKRYLESKFGPALREVRQAMEFLAGAFGPQELAAKAFSLYERFRPAIPPGVQGWGAKGELRPELIRSLARRKI
jgi:hypothetical protein